MQTAGDLHTAQAQHALFPAQATDCDDLPARLGDQHLVTYHDGRTAIATCIIETLRRRKLRSARSTNVDIGKLEKHG